jgi:hypothetical protein
VNWREEKARKGKERVGKKGKERVGKRGKARRQEAKHRFWPAGRG